MPAMEIVGSSWPPDLLNDKSLDDQKVRELNEANC
jgi:hypothetical protein